MNDIQGFTIGRDIQQKFPKSRLTDIKEAIGGDIIKFISDYLDKTSIVEYDIMLPLYISSIGGGIGNLLNQGCSVYNSAESYCPLYGKEELGCARFRLGSVSPHFLYRFGKVADLRVNTMHVAPPGYSKNFFIDLFLDEKTGFLSNIGIPAKKLQNPTEAGYSGTLYGMDEDGNAGANYGYAKKYCAGILAVPEFSYITNLSGTEHSSNFVNDVMEIIEGGHFSRAMAKGSLDYYSYHTLWAATQPGPRFDMSAGLGRRLNFVVIIPDMEMEKRYKEVQEKGYTSRIDEDVLQVIRGYFYKLYQTNNIRQVFFTEEYKEWRNNMKVIRHTDYSLFDNVAFGYNFAVNYMDEGSGEGSHVLYVKLDNRLRTLLKVLAASRSILSNESFTEWTMYDRVLGFHNTKTPVPITKFNAIRTLQSRQYLPWKDAVRRLSMAIEEGYYGSFSYATKHNEEVTVIYKKSAFESAKEARLLFFKDNHIKVDEDDIVNGNETDE